MLALQQADALARTSKNQNFCRNEYNATGLCSRQACPLANSRYATVRSDPADASKLYIYTKIIERAHLPSQLWEKQQLSANYAKALEQIDRALPYWPKFLVHKCKQRLTRLTQVALRSRRIAKEEARLGERIVPKMAPKIRKREETRERKAERAARVDKAIERELIERLRSGAYGDKPLNVEEKMWNRVLEGLERAGEGTRDEELGEGIEEEPEAEREERERELDLEGQGNVEYVSDVEGESEEGEDMEDWPDQDEQPEEEESSQSEEEDGSEAGLEAEEGERLQSNLAGLKRKQAGASAVRPSKRRSVKGPKVGIEYEREMENEPAIQPSLAV